MSHYDCKRCGAYLCMGECEDKENKFTEALARAGMSEKDYRILERTRDVIAGNYHKATYEVGIALEEQLEKLNARLKEVK